MSAEQRKEYAEAWDIVDKHAASTHIFIPHVAQHKKAHKHDKIFHQLAHYKGHAFKDRFHRPKNHQGFNDDSNEEVNEPDIFGDEDINQDNSTVTGNKKTKKRGKQSKERKGTKRGKETITMSKHSSCLVQLTLQKGNEASEDNDDNDDNEHETRHVSSTQEHMPTNSSGFMTQQLKENDGLKESNYWCSKVTLFEVSLSYTNIQCACEQLALDIKRIGGIPTTNKDINDPLTIRNAKMYSRTVDMQKNPFEHQTLQMVAGTWLKVKHAKANSAKTIYKNASIDNTPWWPTDLHGTG
ncbi:hypothetical protein K439DRAFT_1619549 [Ramaria rubella]|nr:hypothetical protein K439DRAFT_1619549 [Ramaria rubella]